MKNRALGVDIGNVIIENRLNDKEQLDEKGYAELPVVDGSLEALKKLFLEFSGNVFLISKCTEWAQEQILSWLDTHDFYNKTGVNRDNIYFVRARHEKDAICKKLGITHFIDDRLEVLSHMIETVPNLILFQPDQDEINKFSQFLPKVIRVENWSEVVSKLK